MGEPFPEVDASHPGFLPGSFEECLIATLLQLKIDFIPLLPSLRPRPGFACGFGGAAVTDFGEDDGFIVFDVHFFDRAKVAIPTFLQVFNGCGIGIGIGINQREIGLDADVVERIPEGDFFVLLVPVGGIGQ